MIRIAIDQEPFDYESGDMVIISPDEDTCNYGYHATFEINEEEVTSTECLSVFCKALEHAGFAEQSITNSLEAMFKYRTE